MEEIPLQNILGIIFKDSLQREEVLLKKYNDYIPDIKQNKIYYDAIVEFAHNSMDHVKIMKDKMVKLNIKG